MLRRTEGIVLKTFAYGEADLIVTYLTPDYGLLKTFAKSPRKTKSRFGSSLEPLTHSRIGFWGKEDVSLPRLTQSDIIHPFEAIRASLSCFLKVAQVLELALHVVSEREENRRAYELLLEYLRASEEGCGSELLVLGCMIKLLDLSGFMPALRTCGRCGREGKAYSVPQGTVFCDSCRESAGSLRVLSPGVASLQGNLAAWPLSRISRIKPTERLLAELSGLIDDHVRLVLEKVPKTASFRK